MARDVTERLLWRSDCFWLVQEKTALIAGQVRLLYVTAQPVD